MLGSSILFLPPPFPHGRKVSQTPESTVWRSTCATGADTEREGEGESLSGSTWRLWEQPIRIFSYKKRHYSTSKLATYGLYKLQDDPGGPPRCRINVFKVLFSHGKEIHCWSCKIPNRMQPLLKAEGITGTLWTEQVQGLEVEELPHNHTTPQAFFRTWTGGRWRHHRPLLTMEALPPGLMASEPQLLSPD